MPNKFIIFLPGYLKAQYLVGVYVYLSPQPLPVIKAPVLSSLALTWDPGIATSTCRV